ncbi:PfkB family carbohydrate kinase [Actinotalea sp. Marseille-Q4924]|uniref:PfkB family carbohydrate kinase n=1 Tax=Actinotalea sp. Marseille-Q4924 TaxID=2866571 RepID=UPI001CE400AA|nr:PfkB family carbohydrate kinase [Actinotalea sp. Marseille-Q4924]
MSAGQGPDGRPHVVVVGDVVLDQDVDGRTERLCPDAPVPVLDVTARRTSPGGAGLTALLVAASGARVTLVAPVATDDGGRTILEHLGARMAVLPLGHAGGTRRKIRIRSAGQSLVRVDDGGPGSPTEVPVDRLRELLASADVVLVSDYGAGTTRDAVVRRLLTETARHRPVVWDPHPKGGDPVPGVAVATPNAAEARGAVADLPDAACLATEDVMASRLRARWDAAAVCVTSGSTGAFVASSGSEPLFVPAPAVSGGDPCGAGDRFAATVAVVLARGGSVGEAVGAAVQDASQWVADGGAEGYRQRADRAGQVGAPAGPAPARGGGDLATADVGDADGDDGPALRAVPGEGEDLAALAARLRSGGRRLVATGGCFDIVHAGHVATLQAARRLGDVLVVLVNSDESVRRLKGPSRPVVTARDRARVLEAFDCVDAVVVFEEDDPRAALAQLRPDVWAKGGDYGDAELPEATVVRQHGGRVVLLPYLGGRSTTSILARSASLTA